MKKFKIDEMFKSIQGEGFNFGKEFFFVRFTGCNLDCSWCDQPTVANYNLSEDELIEKIVESGAKSVLFTGGEPTLQLTQELVDRVKSLGFYIAIESNGTNDLPLGIDYITVSPKVDIPMKVKKTNEIRIATESKDPEFYLEIQRKIESDRYYLSPIYLEKENRFDLETLSQVYDSLREEGFLISMQLHKLMGVR